MKTVYHCVNCNETFTEESLPNFNRLHKCGELARIVEHAPYGEPETAPRKEEED